MDRNELIKAVAERAKTAGVGGRSAFAELVMEIIQPNHLSLELFNAFMPTTTKQPGDQRGRRVRRGRYPVYTMVPGTKHMHAVTHFEEQMTFSFDRLISGVSHSLWEIQSGEVGTVDQMRSDLRADIFDEIVTRIFNLLNTVWNGVDTPNNYTDASSGGVTATVLENMIENVLDATGNVRAIVGTRKALMPVYKFAQYREFVLTGTGTDRAAFTTEAFTEFLRTNRVSTYLGIPLIEIPQIYTQRLPNIKQRKIQDNRILVIGENVGEIALVEGTKYYDYTDPTTQPPNYVLFAEQDFGVLIDNVEGIGIIKTNT